MNAIRTSISAIAAAVAFALAGSAHAQSAPLPYKLVADPSIPNYTTPAQRDEVVTLLTAHLGLWETRDQNSYPYERIVTDDAVYEFPYARSESQRHLEGRAAVAQAVRAFSTGTAERRVSNVNLFETPHADVFFVEYTVSQPAVDGKPAVQQRHMTRITVRDHQIANFLEVWDRGNGAEAVASNPSNPRN